MSEPRIGAEITAGALCRDLPEQGKPIRDDPSMAKRGWPTFEERMAVFSPDGGPPPSERPFRKQESEAHAPDV